MPKKREQTAFVAEAVLMLELVSIGLTMAENGMSAVESINNLIMKARSEGRDVTEDEIKNLINDNRATASRVISKLRSASEEPDTV